MNELEIRNATLPNGQTMCVGIKNGRIESISNLPEYPQYIDARGLILLPGLIDLHVHARDNRQSHKETWQTLVGAAISGGVTTVAAMPNTDPPLTQIEQIESVQKYIGERQTNYQLWFGATPSNTNHIERLGQFPDIICGVKVYRGSSTGDLLVEDDERFEKICRSCTKLGLIVAVHAENEELMKKNRATYIKPDVSDHCFIRDTEVEVTAVARALEIQAATGCEMYFCHISTPEAVDLIVAARDKGEKVYIEVCPHHLVLDNGQLSRTDGERFKMNPPLRSLGQVLRLRDHVFSGNVDTICSDHAPHTMAEKLVGVYDQIPSGVPGVEHIFSIMFNFVRNQKINLEQFVKLTSGRAAQIMGMNKGQIEIGYDADLILVNALKLERVLDGTVKTKCGWTPYENMILPVKPEIVISKGIIVAGQANFS